jgi:fimbrial chaperone protein
MLAMKRLGVRASALAALVLLATAETVPASTFTVNPIQVFLSRRTTSGLLTLRNESSESLRFELTMFAWSQSPSGEMKLEPTQDIVLFPSLLTLKPSEERRVRVGHVGVPGAREKTYRIFVKELPPLDGASSGGVRVLTNMGIPVFVRPDKEVATASLEALRQHDGRLEFALSNTGTVHVVPQRIRVRGLAGTSQLFEQPLQGWYVLASSRRDFSVAVPVDTCRRVTTLMVHVEFGSASLEESLHTPGGACGQ